MSLKCDTGSTLCILILLNVCMYQHLKPKLVLNAIIRTSHTVIKRLRTLTPLFQRRKSHYRKNQEEVEVDHGSTVDEETGGCMALVSLARLVVLVNAHVFLPP